MIRLIRFSNAQIQEINSLCATKVMGWKQLTVTVTGEPIYLDEEGEAVSFTPMMDYSDMFAIVRQLKQEGWTLFLNSRKREASGSFHNGASVIGSRKEYTFDHPDERAVICISALKLREVDLTTILKEG